MAGRSPFWAPQAHADRRPVLLARARIVAAPPAYAPAGESLAHYAGIDLMAGLSTQGPDRAGFAATAAAAGIRLADDDNWGDIFSRVLVERIEPRLGLGRVTVLHEYPAALS